MTALLVAISIDPREDTIVLLKHDQAYVNQDVCNGVYTYANRLVQSEMLDRCCSVEKQRDDRHYL